MNRRLLLSLYDRSGLGAYMPVDLKGHELEVEEHMEKFAELIVRECVGKCEFVADMATITNTGEMARKTKATADSCATMIKQHFGVSE